MSITEHAILHRRNVVKYKAKRGETTPTIEFVEHIFVSELVAESVNRTVAGTFIHGDLKMIIWGVEKLSPMDEIELNGTYLETMAGNILGDMYEIIKILKDYQRQSNWISYQLRRKQSK